MSIRKKRKLSPTEERNVTATLVERGVRARPLPVNDYLQSASQWNLEQDYESKPRKLKGKKQNELLPIKTEDGRVEAVESRVDASSPQSDSFLESSSDGESKSNGKPSHDEPPKDTRSSQEIVREAKEEMARIAGLINQDPEDYVGGLKTLAQFAESANSTVKKLALVTQLAIFKDIIPGYRIRPLAQESMVEKVSKEIRRLRSFEQSLISAYQTYIQQLSTIVKTRHDQDRELAGQSKVALSCVCELLLAVPHFNFREELLKVIVHRLSRRKLDSMNEKCISTLEKLFQKDEEGLASQEAVTMITRMMKARNYEVDESVLNTFLHLRLLNEFSHKASTETIDGDLGKGKGKRPKQPREFRTKRQRKELKELKAVEKEFQEADASVQREERERAQAETLKLVFGAYFRILKTRSPRLMGAVLEGLARYAHLVNQEFFGDLLVTLQELASEAEAQLDADPHDDDLVAEANDAFPAIAFNNTDKLRAVLLCTTTAFALLSSQDAASLKLDLSSFAAILHAILLPLSMSPDLEVTSKTLRLSEPTATESSPRPRTKVNATAMSTLLLRALSSALTPRHTAPVRVAAFAHRLMITALQSPEKTTMAIMTLLSTLATTQGRKLRGLWSTEEQRGDGRFEPLGSIEGGRPYCGTIWEGELLRLHYADGVKKGLGDLEHLVKGLHD